MLLAGSSVSVSQAVQAWRSGLDLVWKGQHREGGGQGLTWLEGAAGPCKVDGGGVIVGTGSQKSAGKTKTGGGGWKAHSADTQGFCARENCRLQMTDPSSPPPCPPGVSILRCPADLSAAFAGVGHLSLLTIGAVVTSHLPAPVAIPHRTTRGHTGHTCPSSHEPPEHLGGLAVSAGEGGSTLRAGRRPASWRPSSSRAGPAGPSP